MSSAFHICKLRYAEGFAFDAICLVLDVQRTFPVLRSEDQNQLTQAMPVKGQSYKGYDKAELDYLRTHEASMQVCEGVQMASPAHTAAHRVDVLVWCTGGTNMVGRCTVHVWWDGAWEVGRCTSGGTVHGWWDGAQVGPIWCMCGTHTRFCDRATWMAVYARPIFDCWGTCTPPWHHEVQIYSV